MDLWRSSRPTPLLKEVHLDQVTQDCVQITFKFLSPTSTRVVFPQDSSISKHRGTLSQNRSSSHQEDHLGRSREQQVREITTYTNRTVLCINEIMLLYKGQQRLMETENLNQHAFLLILLTDQVPLSGVRWYVYKHCKTKLLANPLVLEST
ncbi:small integral membrane protein 13 isoform X3 [Cuculus canorus]|uniref:small integral membrane protein 13 isoform X3 n=1 Tax=Cuculus canorus TaxID=55661 RepID=UPI0023AA73F6|nr:small integral membrane protein 13 isoform X3 [Cuculus canorus]